MKKPNHLSNEKSPYLLQHAFNPVDWYPWSEAAFLKAEKEDKPVFLSIGYSTCHWCHVMEKESFEDEEIAELMNDAFVSIKVDREERPDIDGIYMSVCQMLTGSGGWPLTLIITPDKKPFFAGTYFPKDSRFGRPGMKELIPKLKDIWINRREEVVKSASEISAALNKDEGGTDTGINESIFKKAFKEFKERFDEDYGGFGTAPKFPSPHNFYFLLRYYKKNNDDDALKMIERTLLKMRLGGIYDHIGYGFHRYSTDRKWLVPHFEKMLYDQALLAKAYTELFQLTGESFYRQTAEEILQYVQRDMTSSEGGFFSAEDADSEGVEGKFYLWEKEEIKAYLKDDTELISAIYNIRNEGNYPGEQPGKNIPHMKKIFSEIAEELIVDKNIVIEKVNEARKKLFDVREKRIHPYKDDKILTDWNGLMVSAFAKAAQVFENEDFLQTAERAAEFILQKMRGKGEIFFHRFRENEAGITANVDDYAFFISGLIDLYESDFNTKWLNAAIELNNEMRKYFWDEQNGGFFFTSAHGEKLLVRQKEIYDGAVPSGNSVALLNLLKLGRITGNSLYEKEAFNIANAFSDQINRMPTAFTQTLTGLDFGSGESFEIVVVGKRENKLTKEIIKYFHTKFIPNKVILLKEPDDKEIKKIAPFTESQVQVNDKTTVYICRNYVCERPVTSLEEIKDLLE